MSDNLESVGMIHSLISNSLFNKGRAYFDLLFTYTGLAPVTDWMNYEINVEIE